MQIPAPERTLEGETPAPRHGRLVSLAVPCAGVSLWQFLVHAKGDVRTAWTSADHSLALAGMGAATELAGWGASRFDSIARDAAAVFVDAAVLDERAPDFARPRLFGGFSFSPDYTPDVAWSDFKPAHFIMPHFQFAQQGDQAWLTVNVQVAPNDAPNDDLGELRDELRGVLNSRIEAIKAKHLRESSQRIAKSVALLPPHKHDPVADLSYPMPFAAWRERIESATQQMRSGRLNKVVLSRVAEVRFERAAPVDAALRVLHERYPDCHLFLFEPRPGCSFIGASPELLVRARGCDVETMALAGSIRRGATAAEDDVLAAQLLSDSKELFEHRVVADEIESRLNELGAQVSCAPVRVMKLRNIQHLCTPIRARFDRAPGALALVAALHPTPALGGDPREVALRVIEESEIAPRGWYAAPIGWVDAGGDGAFTVAIRSAVAQGRRAWLFAGAGIVASSQPEKEWDETALKFKPMLEAFDVQSKHVVGQRPGR
jgi:menaquinone-specific isochorismate synthase